MTSLTFDEFIGDCTKQFEELSLSNTVSSPNNDNSTEKVDQLLELLRGVHSKEPVETSKLSESKLIPSDFILSAPLNDKHLKWFELIQKVLIHKCKTLLEQATNNSSIDNSENSQPLNEIQDFILHELAPLHEWMKRKCLSIMSNEKIAAQQRFQVQDKFLKKSMSDWEMFVGPLLEKLSNLMMEQEYRMEMNLLLKEGHDIVTVKHKNKDEGKTVCLNVDKIKGGQLLFKEEPLCSQVITDTVENPFYSKIDYCHHCMKTIFNEKTIQQFPFIVQLMKDDECKNILSKTLTTANTFVPCRHCSLVTYCCEECREKSWNQYHSVLCCRNNVTTPMAQQDNATSSSNSTNTSSSNSSSKTTDHPIILLERLTTKQHRTAPLLIAKIMATVFNECIRSFSRENQENSQLPHLVADEESLLINFTKALHRFERFVQHEEPHPFDALAVQLIKESIECAIQEDGYFTEYYSNSAENEFLKSHSQQISQVLTMLCSVKQYRSLHGLILQNCSTIHPITELHLAAHDHAQIRNKICELLHCTNFETEATRTETLKSLSMKGMGAFAIHNCMNHSCIPNAVSVSDYITHQVSVYACQSSTSSTDTNTSSTDPTGNVSSNNDLSTNTIDTTAVLSKGDEVLISYIDEYLPTDERKKKLKEQYRFDCNCPKCNSNK